MRLRLPRLRVPASWSPGRRAGETIRRLADRRLLLMAAWFVTAGLVAADASYVMENSVVPFGSVLVGIVTMAPIALLLLRVSPLLAWATSMVSAVSYPLLDAPEMGSTLPWTPLQLIVGAVVLVVIGSRYRPLVLILILVGTVIGITVTSTGSVGAPVPGVAFAAGVALVVGRLAGARQRADRRAAEQEEQLAEESSRRVLLEERARIARELHDVVAHHMSVIAVQAETAPYRVGPLSATARDSFDSIAADARTGLTEMRRLLGVLRSDVQPASAQTEPQPTLADLDTLVDSARRAGVNAELITSGDLSQPSAALGLTVYRLVQESLSNAVRHAPGTRVIVRIARSDDTLQVGVRNDAPARQPEPAVPGIGNGSGLAGMRERVALLQGKLTTYREPHGGFVVEATLPYDTVTSRGSGARE